MSGIPTEQEARAFESFHSFRRGWTDGAKGAPKQDCFMKHATRPDLTALYVKGFEAAETARNTAFQEVAAAVGYVPNIMRASTP